LVGKNWGTISGSKKASSILIECEEIVSKHKSLNSNLDQGGIESTPPYSASIAMFDDFTTLKSSWAKELKCPLKTFKP
jgi:hypothetical protein